MQVVLIIIGCLILLSVKGIYDSKKNARILRNKIISSYGVKPDKTLDSGRSQSVVYYNDHHPWSPCHIDDITWNDLDMDSIYFLLNSCKSSIGDEFLYHLLRNPIDDVDELKKRDRIITELEQNEALRTELGIFLAKIGSIKSISVYEYCCRLKNVPSDNNTKHVIQALLLVASIALTFVIPTAGVLAIIAVFIFNVTTYFKRKSEIECYFSIFAYILGILKHVKKSDTLRKADTDHVLQEYFTDIDEAAAFLAKLTRGCELFLNPMGTGDLLQSLLDYIRMAFHIDIILFNSVAKKFINRQDEFDKLFENIGIMDSLLAVASYRAYVGDFCRPELTNCTDAKPMLHASEVAHPLIAEPVCNTIETDTSVLLTGSNASGKSTFLKTIAISAIFAQTIYTVRASSYRASCFSVMSSIALRDSLESGESYYIVEIKSIKRILDRVAEDGIPVLCFIDEVLRGTNTVERIAASTEILKTIAGMNGLCFAATHDIELTYLLEEHYRNCHFEEQIDNDAVIFNYKLHDGRATSRNAIKLLGLMGFDKAIVEAAAERANTFKQV